MAGVDPVTLAIIGGSVGAVTNKDDPLRGAMMGATLGYTGGTLFPGTAAGGSGISAATANTAGAAAGSSGISATTGSTAMTSTGTASAAANAANPYAITQGNLAASEGLKASASQLYSPQAAQAAGMNGMQKLYMANMGLGLLNGGPKNNTVSNQSMGRPGNPQMVNAQPIYNLAAAAPQQQQRRRVISLI